MLFLLIILGMYIIISIVGAAHNVITGTDEKRTENKIEDGEFTVFYPLNAEEEASVKETGVSIEAKFSFDTEGFNGVDNGSSTGSSPVTFRIMKNRKEVNLLDLDEGRTAVSYGEVVIDNLFAKKNSLSLGDRLTISVETFTIVGIGSVPDYDLPLKNTADMTQDSEDFCLIFVSDPVYTEMRSRLSHKAEEYNYSYRLNGETTDRTLKSKLEHLSFDLNSVEDPTFRKYLSEIMTPAEQFLMGSSLPGVTRLVRFLEDENNPRIASSAASDVEIKRSMGMMAGVIIMILFTYVISIFVLHQIQSETGVIGALYSLGVRKSQLVVHYLTLPTVVAFLGGAVGTLLGFSPIGVAFQMKDSYDYYSIPEMPLRYPTFLIIYGLIMPVVISVLVNYLVISKKLNRTPLALLRNEQKQHKVSHQMIHFRNFYTAFQFRQMMKEQRSVLAVIMGLLITMIIFMIGLDCYILCNHVKTENIEDTKYNFMYILKYPDDSVKDEADIAYAESLSRDYMGYRLDVTLLGVEPENPYFTLPELTGERDCAIGSSVAEKYNLSVGDKFILSDESAGRDYAFTVQEITDYSVGLTVFMNIDGMRKLFERNSDYYNVFFSDHALPVDEGRVLSVTTKTGIENAAGIFSEQMMSLVVIMCGVAAVIFLAVMYLMMNVMIERSSFNISLIKIFGYRTSEVRKMYLNGNLFIIIPAAALSILIAKWTADKLYPAFIANTAMGMNLSFSWYHFLIIYLVVILIYLLIEALLIRKLRKITPAEVLKNRE